MSTGIQHLTQDDIPGPRDCLVDPSTVRSVAALYAGISEPTLAQILALFSLAEAAVLFDRLVISEKWRASGGFASANMSFAEPINDALAVADDLVSFSVKFGIPNDAAFDHAFSFCMALQDRFGSTWQQIGGQPPTAKEGFTLEISDTLNVLHRAWYWKTQHVVNPLWEMFFLMEPSRAKTTPKNIYNQLSNQLGQEIRKLQESGHPSVMYVPPIPALILAECKGNLNEFWKSLAKLRVEFAPFRRKHGEYQKVLANPESRSLGELIQVRRDAIADVEQELKALRRKRVDGRKVLEFWDAVANVEAGSQNGELEFSIGGNVKSLLTFSLRGVRSLIVRGRARSIFRLRKKFLAIKGYETLLPNAFGIDVSRLEEQIIAFREFADEASHIAGEPTEDNWAES